ncbi:uncharacterized protein K460DRAFT_270329 [Cucurbitaria berberidis CBS 394.84]|uniref:Uncharacterized protein n=1 Tax=Cucurbitaria berberidis CBS 394.84 TaxID=1168544 RepID=A0A9P4GRM9_9PLEO|nr:uncharacterized protein K460DRAFT_270329 [Cucurbitaria berberidis CBS 394.84]KAF1850562.1 hypothetical protein K460DRAFT_270329 [Cucurbitaria berberidis CBS 394.84]
MPAIAHLQPRLLDGSSPGGVSGTSIALLVCIALVPALLLIWIVVWLLFFYGKDRTCWCTKRKRRAAEPEMLQQRTDASQDILFEKAVYDIPQRPFAAHARAESGSSSDGGRLSKVDPRLSIQSVASASNVPVMQEPKRFV